MKSISYNLVKIANNFNRLQSQKMQIFRFEQVLSQTGGLKFQTGVGP